MTDYGTIKLPRAEYERHNERRQELGLTWAEYVDGKAPEVRNDAEGVPAEIRERLERIESAAKEATNAAQNAERAADELSGGR